MTIIAVIAQAERVRIVYNCFRVFYEVDRDEEVASALTIGVKQGNRLLIGGEEVML